MPMIPSIAPGPIGRPKASTNRVTNGGFETNTTGWTPLGSLNTIERSTAQAKEGGASGLITYQNSVALQGTSPITFTAVMHVGSCWVYIPSDWDGGEIEVRNESFSLAGVTIGSEVATAGQRDQWVRVWMQFTPAAGDLAGTFVVGCKTPAPTVGKFIYIDEVQVEVGSFATPYIHTDGATASRPALKWVA